jgi:hypothetical protein
MTKEITNVVNRTYGEVIYKAIRLDATSGFVIGSTIKLWTVKQKVDILNIIHIHLNDTSDETSIDVQYITST